MAYLRVPYYVYSDGHSMNVDGVAIELPIFDAICAMRWAQLDEQEQAAARHRAIEIGEMGADKLREQMGLPTTMDEIRAELDDING